jgi:tryptophan synthase alpha chain
VDRLATSFATTRGTTGLIPFLTAGFPSLEISLDLMERFRSIGALAIEVGIPFSDPIADGPEIQRASERALRSGAGPDQTLELVRRFRERGSETPVVIMTYANPVLRHGIDAFAAAARSAGADGIILSDLPPDESPEVWSALDRAGLPTIVLIAPTTAPSRLPLLLARCRGFAYCLARTGVTGASQGFSGVIEERVAEVRRHTTLPIAVGFGISSVDQARALRGKVEAIVVGAALMRAVSEGADAGAVERAGAVAQTLIGALA